MPTGVFTRTPEHKAKISEAMKKAVENGTARSQFPRGNIPWNKGLSTKDNEKVRQNMLGLLSYAQSPEGRAKSMEIANKHLRDLWVNMSEGEREEFIERRAERIRETRGAPDAIEKQRQSMISTYKSNPSWAEQKREFMVDFHKNNSEYHEKVIVLLHKGRDKAWADSKKKTQWVRNVVRGNMVRPTYQEQKVIDAISEFNLPYRYTGGGDFILAGKIPDFVNTNGEKKIVEVFGEYWHDRESCEAEDRIELFAQFGFQTLILWGKDLNVMSRKQIALRIKAFK